jgi:hypothetical protein
MVGIGRAMEILMLDRQINAKSAREQDVSKSHRSPYRPAD